MRKNESILIAGDFDAEKFWRKKLLSRLPEIKEISSVGIIQAMDEMLFAFCSENDYLATRFKFDESFGQYLRDLGFAFHFNKIDFQTSSDESEDSIFEIITRDKVKLDYLKTSAGPPFHCDAYAVVPGFGGFINSLGLRYHGPNVNTVEKVNSKVYSSRLSRRLNFGFCGQIVKNHNELIILGKKYLENVSFLIKDPYGVSGKGNILVSSDKSLRTIARYLERQESQGHRSIFVLEPLWKKEIDFSCAMQIAADGQIKIMSVQKMINHQFAYGGSCTAEKSFIENLMQKRYFEKMYAVAGELYREGYTGDVCVDSMLLKSGRVVPVIEINARKTMGIINSRMDRFLSEYNLHSRLLSLDLGFSGKIEFEDILELMESEGLLFKANSKSGIIPLSANTLFINRTLDKTPSPDKLYRGRIYFSLAESDIQPNQFLLEKFKELLESLSLKIYSKVS